MKFCPVLCYVKCTSSIKHSTMCYTCIYILCVPIFYAIMLRYAMSAMLCYAMRLVYEAHKIFLQGSINVSCFIFYLSNIAFIIIPPFTRHLHDRVLTNLGRWISATKNSGCPSRGSCTISSLGSGILK